MLPFLSNWSKKSWYSVGTISLMLSVFVPCLSFLMYLYLSVTYRLSPLCISRTLTVPAIPSLAALLNTVALIRLKSSGLYCFCMKASSFATTLTLVVKFMQQFWQYFKLNYTLCIFHLISGLCFLSHSIPNMIEKPSRVVSSNEISSLWFATWM
jgi:hypothetical protein